MPAQRSPRLSITILLTILAGLFSVLLGLLGNLATNNLPPAIIPYLGLAWPALGVVLLLGLGISIWQVRRENMSSSTPPPEPQKIPSPVPTQATSLTQAQTQQQPDNAPYQSCVLSYAAKDQAFANRLYEDLQKQGISCWFAPHDLKIGDKLRPRIYEAIQRRDRLLLILSEHSIKSAWVEGEVELAFEREREPPEKLILFPIRLDDAVMQTNVAWASDIRRIRLIGDFRNWQDDAAYQRALQRLLRDIRV